MLREITYSVFSAYICEVKRDEWQCLLRTMRTNELRDLLRIIWRNMHGKWYGKLCYKNDIRKYVIIRETGLYQGYCGFPKGRIIYLNYLWRTYRWTVF